MRIAVLGAGRIGKIHGRNVAARPGVKLVAVADPHRPSAEELAAATGAEVRDIDAAIASADVDAVIIGTPTTTHADLIEKAARAGKAIFCEKPVDLSAERIVACLEVVKAAGVPLMIGFNRRFDPNFAALRRRLAAGAIGEVEIVTVLSRDPAPPPASYVATSGGIFRDMMIHDLDMARFLLGDDEPVEVHALGSALVDPEIGAAGDADTALVVMKTAAGRLVQISNSRRATYGYDQRIEVHGSKGMLRAGNVHESTIELASADGFCADPVQHFFLERYAEAYRAELATFVDCVEKGEAPSPSGEDGLAAQRLADAATLSWKTGKPMRL
ncbi:inositol 2-dehydrogenase [Pinisolibacter sp.]|uniref:inositol 2-dehydrogenase n=1 Tax=Pinisolibacter sp. TaxID=2172024 RepID=UPI002FDD3DE0